MRASAFRLPLLAVLPLLTAFTLLAGGCATVFSNADRPEALEPVAVEAAPGRAYEEALALAFDRGYRIGYSSEEDRLIELDVLDRHPLLLDRVRRIDLFIRERDGRTYIHARYHSFEAGNPNDINVRDEDREATERLVEALAERLGGPRRTPLPEEDERGAL